MNILFLSQVLPYPPDAGPKVRSYYVLRALAEQHQVTLVALTRATDTPEAVEHLRSFCHTVHTVPLRRSRVKDALYLVSSLIASRPFLVLRDDVPEMHHTLAAITQSDSFDFVHADQLSTAHFALGLKNMTRVLDQHNAVWTILDRLAQAEPSRLRRRVLRREARLLKEYEAGTCAAFDRVVTVTQEDRAALNFPAYPPRAPIPIIPICIDPQEIAPVPHNAAARDLICVGGMFYPPNVDGMLWFAEQVLPIIWEKSPETRLLVVGARPDKRLLALSERDARVFVTGYVQDTSEYLAAAAAFIVPLRAGGGMRVKILDAWARGVPVVSTVIGAEGIQYLDGENILIADEPGKFANAALHLIHDRVFAAGLAEAGRNWVSRRYDWRTVYRAWDEIYGANALSE